MNDNREDMTSSDNLKYFKTISVLYDLNDHRNNH